ncbi:MAG: hypothetical protein ACI3XR_05900 [Eubacteriales bacterium]
MKRIVNYCNEGLFGNKIHIFRGESYYFCITSDRGETSYWLIDSELDYCYPINTYMKKNNFQYCFDEEYDELDFTIDIDTEKSGRTRCPEFLADLIRNRLSG